MYDELERMREEVAVADSSSSGICLGNEGAGA
jgi:hypothetical protein